MSLQMSSRRIHNPGQFIGVVTPIGLRLADAAECDAAHTIAAELISPNVALALTFRRIQQRTASAIFVWSPDEEIVGLLGMLPLTLEGLEAVREYRFDPKNPPAEFLCRPGDSFAAVYGWGVVGRTRRASAAVVLGAMALREFYADIPFFTRAVTPAGSKVVLGRMGYSPYPGAPDDLLWNPVRPSQERAA